MAQAETVQSECRKSEAAVTALNRPDRPDAVH